MSVVNNKFLKPWPRKIASRHYSLKPAFICYSRCEKYLRVLEIIVVDFDQASQTVGNLEQVLLMLS